MQGAGDEGFGRGGKVNARGKTPILLRLAMARPGRNLLASADKEVAGDAGNGGNGARGGAWVQIQQGEARIGARSGGAALHGFSLCPWRPARPRRRGRAQELALAPETRA